MSVSIPLLLSLILSLPPSHPPTHLSYLSVVGVCCVTTLTLLLRMSKWKKRKNIAVAEMMMEGEESKSMFNNDWS